MADRKRLKTLVKKARCVLGYSPDRVEVVGERRMMAKLSSQLENMQDTLTAVGGSFADRLFQTWCVTERYHKSFLPAAVRRYNQRCSQ